MQRVTFGAIAGIALALLALLSEALPIAQEWILFGVLAGIILSKCRCNDKTSVEVRHG